MRFLVFGFSVTAETGKQDGYVERCALRCQTERPEITIEKVGIGGMQPNHARHLIEDIVRNAKPDALIVEIATAVYRLRAQSPEQIADHVAGMEAIFDICKREGIRCGILDLPQTGIREDDWLPQTDEELSHRYNVPLRVVPLTDDTLRDNVHPNDLGKDLYAQALLDLVVEVERTVPDFSKLASHHRYGAFLVADLLKSGHEFREFVRAGFRAPMLSLPAGKVIPVALPEPVMVTGLVILMGPTTGTLQVRTGECGSSVNCFDRHCYYERANGKPLNPEMTDKLWLQQRADLPTAALLKGEKNLGPRVGGITHILYEK